MYGPGFFKAKDANGNSFIIWVIEGWSVPLKISALSIPEAEWHGSEYEIIEPINLNNMTEEEWKKYL